MTGPADHSWEPRWRTDSNPFFAAALMYDSDEAATSTLTT